MSAWSYLTTSTWCGCWVCWLIGGGWGGVVLWPHPPCYFRPHLYSSHHPARVGHCWRQAGPPLTAHTQEALGLQQQSPGADSQNTAATRCCCVVCGVSPIKRKGFMVEPPHLTLHPPPSPPPPSSFILISPQRQVSSRSAVDYITLASPWLLYCLPEMNSLDTLICVAMATMPGQALSLHPVGLSSSYHTSGKPLPDFGQIHQFEIFTSHSKQQHQFLRSYKKSLRRIWFRNLLKVHFRWSPADTLACWSAGSCWSSNLYHTTLAPVRRCSLQCHHNTCGHLWPWQTQSRAGSMSTQCPLSVHSRQVWVWLTSKQVTWFCMQAIFSPIWTSKHLMHTWDQYSYCSFLHVMKDTGSLTRSIGVSEDKEQQWTINGRNKTQAQWVSTRAQQVHLSALTGAKPGG